MHGGDQWFARLARGRVRPRLLASRLGGRGGSLCLGLRPVTAFLAAVPRSLLACSACAAVTVPAAWPLRSRRGAFRPCWPSTGAAAPGGNTQLQLLLGILEDAFFERHLGAGLTGKARENASAKARSQRPPDPVRAASPAGTACALAVSRFRPLPAVSPPAGGRVALLVVQNPSFNSLLVVDCGCKDNSCSHPSVCRSSFHQLNTHNTRVGLPVRLA